MPKRKEGQRFKGTHWWEKKRSSGEDDNPVASTASERKLLADDDSDSENERDLPQTCEETAREDPGYRLVHLSSLKQAFEKNHHCQDAQMILVEDEGKRFGQNSVFSIQCSKCKMEAPLQTSKTTESSWNPRDATDINRRVVYAASETGIGREGMATMCDILNMPQPISTKAWHDHNNALYAAHKTVIEKHLKSTRDRLYRTLTKDSSSTTEEEVIDVAVTFDGTWSKRGHTANYGFCFAIAVETGQVLDYGFKSKICWECNSKKAKPDDVEFQEWYESHKNNCSKNDRVFLELLKPVFRHLSERSLLLRCLPGYSQNQNESLNGVVWSKAPKHKFKGPKSIEMAGMSAVLQFDCGQYFV